MYEDLFQKALNIEDPWVLKGVDFDQDAKKVDLYLDFAPGTKFDCPVCNNPGCSAYDTHLLGVSGLSFQMHQSLKKVFLGYV